MANVTKMRPSYYITHFQACDHTFLPAIIELIPVVVLLVVCHFIIIKHIDRIDRIDTMLYRTI